MLFALNSRVLLFLETEFRLNVQSVVQYTVRFPVLSKIGSAESGIRELNLLRV